MMAEFLISTLAGFSLDKYKSLERGEISSWKWNLVRRGGELLKHYYEEGKLGLPPCAKWDIIHDRLRITPSPEELADELNIFALVWKMKRELEKTDYSARTQQHF
jgi:hypothetical protein